MDNDVPPECLESTKLHSEKMSALQRFISKSRKYAVHGPPLEVKYNQAQETKTKLTNQMII